MTGSKGKVLVAMSGGVDSSVAAALLKEDGYEVVGCFMRLGSPGESLEDGADVTAEACGPDGCDDERAEDDGHNPGTGSTGSGNKLKIGKQGCCSINDAKDAQLVAAKLDIPFYVLNFKRDFGRIIDYFVGEYNAGRTPNPCVRCNDWLKFGKLATYAASMEADHVATGHYARVVHTEAGPQLLRGVDRDKDQSYVLFGSPRDQLAHMLFPVGAHTKPRIRQIAERFDLPVFDKPDSQEICFVPDMDYAGVIKRRTPDRVERGEIRDTAGNRLGTHGGHQHFTIGQRRGLGVAMGYPVYVVDKDPASNTVTVGPRDELASATATADRTNWLIDPPREAPLRCDVKIRYNAAPVPAEVQATGADELTVRFDEPQFAVAPGQALVCYDGDRVLGGGWLREADSG